MNPVSLYRRVLRGQFDTLEPVLQHFHDSSASRSAIGQLTVEYGPSRLARFMARRLKMPPEGERQAVTLEITVNRGIETWERRFGDVRMVTNQFESQGRLVESAGLLRLAFELSAEHGGLVFYQRRAWLGRLPLPQGLAPRASARIVPRGERWQVDVQLRFPTGGLFVRYHGVMAPISRGGRTLAATAERSAG